MRANYSLTEILCSTYLKYVNILVLSIYLILFLKEEKLIFYMEIFFDNQVFR